MYIWAKDDDSQSYQNQTLCKNAFGVHLKAVHKSVGVEERVRETTTQEKRLQQEQYFHNGSYYRKEVMKCLLSHR